VTDDLRADFDQLRADVLTTGEYKFTPLLRPTASELVDNDGGAFLVDARVLVGA
jgi:hypothetical protein